MPFAGSKKGGARKDPARLLHLYTEAVNVPLRCGNIDRATAASVVIHTIGEGFLDGETSTIVMLCGHTCHYVLDRAVTRSPAEIFICAHHATAEACAAWLKALLCAELIIQPDHVHRSFAEGIKDSHAMVNTLT